jgi:hypothetical protein
VIELWFSRGRSKHVMLPFQQGHVRECCHASSAVSMAIALGSGVY